MRSPRSPHPNPLPGGERGYRIRFRIDIFPILVHDRRSLNPIEAPPLTRTDSATNPCRSPVVHSGNPSGRRPASPTPGTAGSIIRRNTCVEYHRPPVFSLYFPCIFPVFSLYFPCIFPVFYLYFPCIFPVFSLYLTGEDP